VASDATPKRNQSTSGISIWFCISHGVGDLAPCCLLQCRPPPKKTINLQGYWPLTPRPPKNCSSGDFGSAFPVALAMLPYLTLRTREKESTCAIPASVHTTSKNNNQPAALAVVFL